MRTFALPLPQSRTRLVVPRVTDFFLNSCPLGVYIRRELGGVQAAYG